MKAELFTVITLTSGTHFFINAPASDSPFMLFGVTVFLWTISYLMMNRGKDESKFDN